MTSIFRSPRGRGVGCAAAAALVAWAGAATHARAQATNESSVPTDPLNPPVPAGAGRIQRLLSAPRVAPGTASALHFAVHLRGFTHDTGASPPDSDYRERITVFGAAPFQLAEDDPATDEGGAPLTIFGGPGQPIPIVFGGAAYTWNSLFTASPFPPRYLDNGFDEESPEATTFGGLTTNGDGKIAFFAGLVTEGSVSDINREAIPIKIIGESNNLSNPPDLMYPGAKPLPMARAIYTGDRFGLRLRALETAPSPPDPDPTRSFQGNDFVRLHPSDYVASEAAPLFAEEVSLFAEQRFSRVSNIAMNKQGHIAFRGDIGTSPTDPALGIWAEQVTLSGTTLHRVFVEDLFGSSSTGPSSFPFVHNASNNPFDVYQIARLGAPVITDEAQPRVAAYALLRGCANEVPILPCNFGTNPFAVAIVARRPGKDGSNPNGYPPEILAIEGEDFNVVGSSDTFQFLLSGTRTEGMPGLADIVEAPLPSPLPPLVARDSLKSAKAPMEVEPEYNFSIYKPHPAMNGRGQVAFLGRLGSVNGAPVTAVDPTTGLTQDEGVYTTRGRTPTAEFERVRVRGRPGAGDDRRCAAAQHTVRVVRRRVARGPAGVPPAADHAAQRDRLHRNLAP